MCPFTYKQKSSITLNSLQNFVHQFCQKISHFHHQYELSARFKPKIQGVVGIRLRFVSILSSFSKFMTPWKSRNLACEFASFVFRFTDPRPWRKYDEAASESGYETASVRTDEMYDVKESGIRDDDDASEATDQKHSNH